MAFLPDILKITIGKPEESFESPKSLEQPIRIEPFTYDNIIKVINQHYPDGHIISIREAIEKNTYIEIKLDFKKPLIKEDAAQLYIDTQNREIISQFDPRKASFLAHFFFLIKHHYILVLSEACGQKLYFLFLGFLPEFFSLTVLSFTSKGNP